MFQIAPKRSNLKEQIRIISQFLWVRKLAVTQRGGRAKDPSRVVAEVSPRTAVIRRFDQGRSICLEQGSLSRLLPGSLRSSPRGPSSGYSPALTTWRVSGPPSHEHAKGQQGRSGACDLYSWKSLSTSPAFHLLEVSHSVQPIIKRRGVRLDLEFQGKKRHTTGRWPFRALAAVRERSKQTLLLHFPQNGALVPRCVSTILLPLCIFSCSIFN